MTHVLISKIQRALKKRSSLCLNTNRNFVQALQKTIKQQISLQLPFNTPHFCRFLFKSVLYAEQILYTEAEELLKGG